jgi:hypothetical protein
MLSGPIVGALALAPSFEKCTKTRAGPQIVIAKAQVVVTPIPPLTSDLPFITQSISLFGRVWPVTGLAAAVIVNLAWVGFLGYGLSKLVETAFF